MNQDNDRWLFGCLLPFSSFILHPFPMCAMTRTQRQIEEHRQGQACLEVWSAGRPCPGVGVWAEQETHAFAFGCVAPDPASLPEAVRQRCHDRLTEVFNRLMSADQPTEPGVLRVEVQQGIRPGQLLRELDRLSSPGRALEVRVSGRSAGLGPDVDERAAAERVAELYTLCFAHPGVCAIVWEGFWDGEPGADGGGLLRRDFSPRPAFRYLQKLIGTVWHSRAAGETDEAGRFHLRAFFGDYRVAARIGEEPATVGVLCCRPGPGPSVVRLDLPGGDSDSLARQASPE